MEYVGTRPDVISYTTLIGGHCLVGRIDEAAKSLDVMLSVEL
jgi:leucine-rich PPR motif-containing protein